MEVGSDDAEVLVACADDEAFVVDFEDGLDIFGEFHFDCYSYFKVCKQMELGLSSDSYFKKNYIN